ncbi:unnamed protein product [Ectocarpus sp. 13 AM-2016]
MSGLRRTRRRGEPHPRSAPVFFTAIEAQAVGKSEITALRALLLPDYDGVAVAFASLLVKVTQRCKRDDQVDGRVLHACEAFGVCEGRPVSVEMLARRLTRFGLAWHGFTTEECQAFICDELDTDEDGQVRVQDIFAFLRSLWAQQAHRVLARPRQSLALGGERSCRGGYRRRGRRRQAAVEAGIFATRKFPRGLQQKLRAAAGRARLCGVDVLKALQGAASSSPRCCRCVGDVKDSSSLGVEATARFLRSIGVGFDSHHASVSPNRGFGERLSRPRGEADARGEADLRESRDLRAYVRPREPFPSEEERVAHVPSSSSQRDRWSGDDLQNRCLAGEETRREPWWAQGDVLQPSHDQCEGRVAEGQNRRTRGRDGVRTTRLRPPDTTARVERCWSNPSESPKLPSRLSRVIHGGRTSGCCDEDAGSGREYAVGAADGVGDEEAREDIGACNSQRLRRAAEDLKRMQSEYLALQRQVRGETTDNSRTPPPPPPPPPPPTTAEVANLDDSIEHHCRDDTAAAAAAAGRRSSHNTLLRPTSFLPGHTNPKNNGAHHCYFSRAMQQQQQQHQHQHQHQQKQKQPWLGYEGADGGTQRDWGTEDGSDDDGGGDDGNGRRCRDRRKEEGSFFRPPSLVIRPKSSSSPSNAFDNSGIAAARYQHHTAHADCSEGARQNGWVTGWPRRAPDTRRCRALLLMAAQGKACTEDTFDVATARNGFSGVRSLQALGLSEEKGSNTPTPRGRRCDAWARNRDDDRGRASHRGAVHVASDEVATDENGSSSEPRCMRGVHAFLKPVEAATRRTAWSMVLPEEDEKTRDWRDRTPERRPARPPAIKSPMYARRSRSEERNVWDKRTGRWVRSTSKGRSAARIRGQSVDNPCNVRTMSGRDLRCF